MMGITSNVVLVFDITSAWQHRFLHGAAVDQVFMEESVGEILWGLADNQGTIRDVGNYDPLTDTSSVLNHRQFDAYGGITSESDPNVNYRYAYTGRYFDEDTGIQDNRGRWYDAETARFLSIDPILINSGDTGYSRSRLPFSLSAGIRSITYSPLMSTMMRSLPASPHQRLSDSSSRSPDSQSPRR